MAFADNFRRDLAGKVYRISQYTLLDPIIDKDFSTLKMNERFIKMNEAVRTCFEAIADVASRDPSFLPSFFQGTINPVFVKTLKYARKDLFFFVNGFNSNGTPQTFPDSETRVVYSYPEVGDVSTNDYNCLLFKNGKLVPFSQYIIDNTAYGLKAFVRSSFINNNDEITLAVFRVYNKSYSSWRKNFTSTTSVVNEIISIPTYFPNFYNVSYLKLSVRRSGKVYFEQIPPSLWYIVQDDAGKSIRVFCDKLTFNNGDTLLVHDSVSYFEKYVESVRNTTTNVITDPVYEVNGYSVLPIELTQEVASLVNGVMEKMPVGFSSEEDFDVWLDGLKLIPKKHYRVVPFDINKNKPATIVINMDKFPSTTTPTNEQRKGVIYVMKNLPCIKGKTTVISKDSLDPSGLEVMNDYFVPAISNIGEVYSNGLFVDSKNIRSQSKDIFTFSVPQRNDFFFKLNAPFVQTTIDLVEEANKKHTEVDRMITITGGREALVDRLKTSLPTIPTGPYTTFNLLGGTPSDTYKYALQVLPQYYMSYNTSSTNGLVVNPNIPLNSATSEIAGGEIISFNSNITLDREVVLNANETSFQIGVV